MGGVGVSGLAVLSDLMSKTKMIDWRDEWAKAVKVANTYSKVSLTKKYDKCLIVAHGDLDGIVSAIMMRYIFKNKLNNEPETIFTRPHEVKKYNPKALKKENRGIKTDVYDLIIVVDIAVNNRDPNTTLNFVKHVAHKLLWIDHHKSDIGMPHCITKKKDSCVQLIQQLFHMAKYTPKIDTLIRYAHETDMGNGNNIFDHSLKINLRSDEARYEIYRYGTSFVGGALEDEDHYKIMRKDSRHNELILNSNEVIKTRRKIVGNVSIIDMIDYRNKTINSTYVFHQCYKQTPIVVIKYLSTNKEEGGEEYFKIARSRDCRVHLPRLFGLKSGASYRITVKNEHKVDGKKVQYTDAELCAKLEQALKRSQPKK